MPQKKFFFALEIILQKLHSTSGTTLYMAREQKFISKTQIKFRKHLSIIKHFPWYQLTRFLSEPCSRKLYKAGDTFCVSNKSLLWRVFSFPIFRWFLELGRVLNSGWFSKLFRKFEVFSNDLTYSTWISRALVHF